METETLETYTQIYLHLVWATWDRYPFLTEEITSAVHACIRAECDKLKAEVLVIGGMPDHVHLLLRLPTTLSIAELMKHVKGVSSHLVTHQIAPDVNFKWQGGYGAFSVSPDYASIVREYILDQKRHHQDGSLNEDVELLVG